MRTEIRLPKAKRWIKYFSMKRMGFAVLGVFLSLSLPLFAQVDPVRRDFLQFGFQQPFEGHSPLGAYAFYYRNQPNFLQTNMTLRLAVAPVYLDSEVGFTGLLGPNTDVGIGVAGGGFADGYSEIRAGKYYPGESFDGHGAELSASIYHLFNPGDRIPLNFVLRGSAHYSVFVADDTAANFVVPDNRTTFNVRTGLRFGGIEPTLFPALAMELSIWYEGQFRTDSGYYGFQDLSGHYDRYTQPQSHLFWARAALAYTLPKSQQSFTVSLQGGTSVEADRFSAYRLGGSLPLVSEFPLSLPGYYYQEISARQFALLNASYLVPLDEAKRWNLNFQAATAVVNYISGMSQPGDYLTGVGAGVLYRAKSDRWKVIADYGYGINAIRSDGRGASSIDLLVQIDLDKMHGSGFHPLQPGLWRGWRGLFGN
jgi:hypothetical protein